MRQNAAGLDYDLIYAYASCRTYRMSVSDQYSISAACRRQCRVYPVCRTVMRAFPCPDRVPIAGRLRAEIIRRQCYVVPGDAGGSSGGGVGVGGGDGRCFGDVVAEQKAKRAAGQGFGVVAVGAVLICVEQHISRSARQRDDGRRICRAGIAVLIAAADTDDRRDARAVRRTECPEHIRRHGTVGDALADGGIAVAGRLNGDVLGPGGLQQVRGYRSGRRKCDLPCRYCVARCQRRAADGDAGDGGAPCGVVGERNIKCSIDRRSDGCGERRRISNCRSGYAWRAVGLVIDGRTAVCV